MNSREDAIKSFESLDEIQSWILRLILDEGGKAHPRGMHTLEICPVAFTLTNPRRRCVTNQERRWSFPLALGEFCWHVSGSNKLDFIGYYAPRWRDFAGDIATVRGSCYGHKLFTQVSGRLSQWDRMVKLLRTDDQSRRALIPLSDALDDFEAGTADVACASMLQFFIRQRKLHAVVYMRSNDAIWGLPYDIFLFTMLQELLCCELGLELGTYSHFVGSLHLYERHFHLAQRIIASQESAYFEMPKMKQHDQLPAFLEAEEQVRKGQPLTATVLESLSEYWQELLIVLDWYRLMKTQKSQPTGNGSGASLYFDLLQNNLPKAKVLS
ncbi:MAG TPA: thymidylate synthase [Pyrinomonadaceae bacterium]|jgi:thymidylate synthase